jgi:DNA-binding transcriptional LysR family regulator
LVWARDPLQDRRLRSIKIHEEPLFAVAGTLWRRGLPLPARSSRASPAEPVLAYNLERPLLDSWLSANSVALRSPSPALTGRDLRFLRSMLQRGFGWTVLPGYLCAKQIANGELIEIPAPIIRPSQSYYLSWAPRVLRHPRVSAVHRTLVAATDFVGSLPGA